MTVPIPTENFELEGDYVLRVRGDHPDHDLREGDYVTVRRASFAEVGQLVVAKIDGGFHVREAGAEILDVQGVVVMLVRRLG